MSLEELVKQRKPSPHSASALQLRPISGVTASLGVSVGGGRTGPVQSHASSKPEPSGKHFWLPSQRPTPAHRRVVPGTHARSLESPLHDAIQAVRELSPIRARTD